MELKKFEVECLITQMENNPDLLDNDTFENELKTMLKSTGE